MNGFLIAKGIGASLLNDIKHKASDIKVKAEGQYGTLKGKVLTTAKEATTTLGKAGDHVREKIHEKSDSVRKLGSRFATSNPLRTQVGELKARLRSATTTKEVESVAKDTMQLAANATEKVDNVHVLKQLGKTAQVLGAALEGHEIPANLNFTSDLEQQLSQVQEQVQATRDEQNQLIQAKKELQELQQLQIDLEGLQQAAADLAAIVNEQGEMTDQLVDHVEDALSTLVEAKDQMNLAEKTSGKNIKIKLAIGIALTVLAIIALLVIFL